MQDELPIEEGCQAGDETRCDLDLPRWSVVSFDRLEGSGLTYDQASDLRNELERRKVAGLCIVTTDAANRMKEA